MVRVVKLVGRRVEQRPDSRRDALVRAVAVIGRGRIGFDGCDDIGILRHGIGPRRSGVELRPVAATHVGDVPHGVGPCAVLQRGTRHGIGEPFDPLLPVGQRVPCAGSPVVGCRIPEIGIQYGRDFHPARPCSRRLTDVFRLERILRDGVQQTRPIQADGGLQPAGYILGNRVGVERLSQLALERQFGINQGILFPVGESQRQPARGLHLSLGQRPPLQVQLVFVHRRQERRHGLGLRHARHLRDIGAVIAVGTVNRMIEHKQIAVAPGVGLVRLHPLAVAVARMAVDAGGPHIGRSESAESGRARLREVVFDKHFSEFEGGGEVCIGDGRRLVFVACRSDILRRTEFSARIPFFRCKYTTFLADILVIVLSCRTNDVRAFVIVRTGRQEPAKKYRQQKDFSVGFHFFSFICLTHEVVPVAAAQLP